MAYRKLGRNTSARKALFRDLATDLLINEKIVTTEAKAKALRPIVEKTITLGKGGTLHDRRQAASFIRKEAADEDQDAIQKLFDDIGPRYEERQGGYTRIIKMDPRKGDGTPMAVIELV
ncbi:50S ribosomal protein L17 [Salicibibacter halophilus]|uniref:Large ribosomal subunit protein bL17 n=1 Tax=Salicibibacter halophilus TaxID=2502791 RepID=A0A514LI24_9BACI|nr:50S ribosomal protein L17 [Salicibibacter halophilus]QDI91479.1 50S ribosomal protein L17 [Salicibibacter halophilus]